MLIKVKSYPLIEISRRVISYREFRYKGSESFNSHICPQVPVFQWWHIEILVAGGGIWLLVEAGGGDGHTQHGF